MLDKALAERRAKGGKDTLDTIIDLYRQSPEFTSKKPNTQREYRLRLDQISAQFGKVPIRFFNGPDIRREIILWRDGLANTPRAADRCVGMLSTVLSWAQSRTIVNQNAAAEIDKLHRVNRADLIWEARHWDAVKNVPGHIYRVLLLASLTGLRIGDLLALTWEQVTPDYIDVDTQKTGAMATIPMHAELRRFLVGPGKGPILRTTRMEAWTPDGWQSSWRKAKPDGFDRKVHDLRGTFVTRLMVAGISDAEIATITGWQTERIATIRARYVDRGRAARAMAERMGR